MSEKTASKPTFSISLGDCIFLGSNVIFFIFSFLRWWSAGNDGENIFSAGVGSRGWMAFVACILCILLVGLKTVILPFLSEKAGKLLSRAPWYFSVFIVFATLTALFDIAGNNFVDTGVGLWFCFIFSLIALATMFITTFLAENPFGKLFAAPMKFSVAVDAPAEKKAE